MYRAKGTNVYNGTKIIAEDLSTEDDAKNEARILNQERAIFLVVRDSLRQLNREIKNMKGIRARWTMDDTEQVLRSYLDPGKESMPDIVNEDDLVQT